MTLVTSQQQPLSASTTGVNRQADELRRRNVAEINSGVSGLGERDAIGDHEGKEKEDKVKEKVS